MGNCFSVQFGFENFVIRGWDSIVGQANYVRSLKETLPNLSAALEELRAKRNDVQREVDLAEQRLMIRLEQVQLWLSKAENMITEAETLIADGSREINNLCLGDCVSKNCLSTYKFGKRVAKMLHYIKDHMSKAAIEKVAENQPTALVVVRPDEGPVALECTIDKVWSCIMDKDVGIIGLHGLGGVGKTTLLTQINNKFSSTINDFDVVIWAFVSKNCNVGVIQDEIGGNIGFTNDSWKSKRVDQKAIDIYGVLRSKKFVVLLDDLWERVDLKKVGIPKPSEENGSKLVFTTRSLEVCGEMEAGRKIKVECLEPEKAWRLFQDKVGHETLNSHSDIPKLAKQVAEKCGGLPLALITIGRAMASKITPGEWKYTIKKLEQFALPNVEKEVFPLLKFSYDNLTVTMKYCLLYCCLYDNRIHRKKLVEYWFCEGLLNEFDRISEAQMQGDYIINSLLNACLLEKSGECFVKMHDVIRDMTLWIACKHEAGENNFFVKAGAQLLEEPDVKAWEGAKRMSVMKNKIEVLTGTPKCPNLQTLFLSDNKLQGISGGFFRFMPHLTVLNLSNNIGLGALPEGVSQLISLECLDLSRTGITELPLEFKSLTKLKMLDLSYMNNLGKIPRHLISSFSSLQIFRIRGLTCGNHLDEDNVLSKDYGNLIEELKSLQHLNILSIPAIKSKHALERFLSFHLFRCCTQSLQLSDFRESNVFDVLCLENMDHLEDLNFINCGSMLEMKMEKLHTRVPPSPTTNYTPCFHTLIHVTFEKCNGLMDVTWLILAPNLRYVKIMGCAKMEEIMSEGKLGEIADVVGIPYPTPFLKLEKLYLFDLPELKSIYSEALPFPCLKYLFVRNCRELKKLPLNSNSATKGNLLIRGNEDWRSKLEWENEATRQAFLSSWGTCFPA